MSIKRSLTATMAAGGITLAAFALPALAQDSGDSSVDTETSVPTQEDREAKRAERQAAFAQALADKLDVPVEDVEAALAEIKEERQAERQAEITARLDEKLAAGEITQEQYDTMIEQLENGEFPGRRGPRGFKGPHHGGFGPSGPASAETESASSDV